LCREHGQQLVDLALMTSSSSAATTTTKKNEKEKDEQGFDGFELFGIVKETGVDDVGLASFYKDHYPYPLYRDENLDFYNAFGSNKKITDSMSWSMILNPFKIYKGMQKMKKRMSSKGLEGNMVGEGLKTGGIIIFGNDGEAKYCYPEITGSELVVDDLLTAIQDVRSSSSIDSDNGNNNSSTDNNDEL